MGAEECKEGKMRMIMDWSIGAEELID